MRHVATKTYTPDPKPLTEPVLLILTSLADQPRHGYALIQDIGSLSGGRVRLSTGTLFGALRRLLEDALVPDGELIGVADPPWSGTNCTVTGDLAALASGRRVVLREAGRITVTGVPVPDEPRRAPSAPGDRRYYPYRGDR